MRAGFARSLAALAVIAASCAPTPIAGTDCGPLSATSPADSPYSPPSRIRFLLARRIDVAVRFGDAEWCIAGVRIFEGGAAELVGRDRRSPPGPEVPWRGAQLDLRATTITIWDASGRSIPSSETIVRDDRVRSIDIPAPVLGPADPPEYLRTLKTTTSLELEAPLLRTVGPSTFAPVPIADGPIDRTVDIGAVTMRLSALRILPDSVAVAYRRLDERLPAPYVNAALFSAVDDAGTVYRYRGEWHSGGRDPWLYALFDPAPPANARTITFTVELFAPTGDTWRVVLPFR